MHAATEKEWKDKLLSNTQKVLELGAFGAPWLMVKNDKGKYEPFFGSDRYVERSCVTVFLQR
jgi:2-hydroxychromene-2-carboxylate isomerase